MQMGLVLLVQILSLSGMYARSSFNVGSEADSRQYSIPPMELLSFSVLEVVKFDIIISFPEQGSS